MACSIEGHKFEPRYTTTSEPDTKGMLKLIEAFENVTDPSDYLHMVKETRVYKGDICIYCGEVRLDQSD